MVLVIDGQLIDVTAEYTDGIDWMRCTAKRYHQAMNRFMRTGKSLRFVF